MQPLFWIALEDKPVQQGLGGSMCCSCSLTLFCFLFQKTDLAQEPKVSGAIWELAL